MRKHKNKIYALLDFHGQFIYDFNNIKHEAIEYYQKLFNGNVKTQFHHVDTRVQINNTGREFLFAPITIEEAKAALYSINDSKSPGPDGFSSKIFKLHWDIFDAVLEVFMLKKLPWVINHNLLH